jgi:hypothetical protein
MDCSETDENGGSDSASCRGREVHHSRREVDLHPIAHKYKVLNVHAARERGSIPELLVESTCRILGWRCLPGRADRKAKQEEKNCERSSETEARPNGGTHGALDSSGSLLHRSCTRTAVCCQLGYRLSRLPFNWTVSFPTAPGG